MNKNQTFNSLLLQKAYSECENIALDHLEKVRKVSDDIKLMEKKLKSSCIPFELTYVFYTEKNSIGDYDITFDHCIFWGKTKKGEKRLFYRVYSTQTIFDYDNEELIEEGSPELTLSLPLIETKVALRLKVADELANFFKAIMDTLEKEHHKQEVVIDSLRYQSCSSTVKSLHDFNEVCCDYCNGNPKIFCALCRKV